MKKAPKESHFSVIGSQLVDCFRKIRRGGLFGRGVPLGLRSEVSKTLHQVQAHFLCLLPTDQLSASAPVSCLPGCHHAPCHDYGITPDTVKKAPSWVLSSINCLGHGLASQQSRN